jgi:putative hemolysin
MNRMPFIPVWTLVLSVFIISGCSGLGEEPSEESTPDDAVELPNPASVFCEERGYTLEMRTEANGTYGVCIFPDGSECEEWAYYRGECKPSSEQAVDALEAPSEGAPSPSATAPPPADCVDDSELVSDLTVPDGTMIMPGDSFIKTWQLRNSGTCTWTTQYQFYDQFSGSPGTRISAPESIYLTQEVLPGETVDLSVEMVAPNTAGEYTSTWRMANPGGGAFGNEASVTIVVGESASSCVNDSEFVADVTVPDGTEFRPGEAFTKTWRLRNSGTCTWTTQYQFYDQFSGVPETRISAPESIYLTQEVPPGGTVDLSVEMVAPNVVGEYTSWWSMAIAGGAFGARPYVSIVVTE